MIGETGMYTCLPRNSKRSCASGEQRAARTRVANSLTGQGVRRSCPPLCPKGIWTCGRAFAVVPHTPLPPSRRRRRL